MVSPPEEGVLNEARDVDNNIIVSDSTLQSILPPQLKKISVRYKFMCGCECWIYDKSIHSSLISYCGCSLSKINTISQNSQNIRSGENYNRLFETYKNYVVSYGCHIYATTYDMYMATICAYPPSQHAFPQWKCVFCCCLNFPCIDLPDQ